MPGRTSPAFGGATSTVSSLSSSFAAHATIALHEIVDILWGFAAYRVTPANTGSRF